MKKFKRSVCVSALLTVFCLSISGCGKMTIEKLMTNMDEAMAGKAIAYSEVGMDMTASMGMSVMGMDMSMDMVMNMDMDMWTSEDPIKSYMEGTMHMEVLEQEIDSDMEIYMEENGDVLSTYTYSGMDDSWSYSEEEFDREEYLAMNDVSHFPMEDRFSDAVLDEETVEINGREAYVLHITCTGDDMNSLMDKVGGSVMNSSEYSDLSFDGLSVPAVYYVDTETFLPIQIELDMEGMDTLINDMLEKELGSLGSDSGSKGLRGDDDTSSLTSSLDDVDVNITEITFHMTLSNISFDPQDVPSVPEDVKESLSFDNALEDVGVSINDSTYVLKNDDCAIKVVIPDDYTDMDSGEDTLSFYKGDYSAFIEYMLVTDDEIEYFEEDLKDYYGDSYEAENVQADLGTASVYWIEEDGYNLICILLPLDNCTLFSSAMDFEGCWSNGKEAATDLLSGVGELTYKDLQ